MTQRDLAAALEREHGMVARIELGERRVDMIEAFDVFEALGADRAEQTLELMKKFSRKIIRTNITLGGVVGEPW